MTNESVVLAVNTAITYFVDALFFMLSYCKKLVPKIPRLHTRWSVPDLNQTNPQSDSAITALPLPKRPPHL